MKDCVFCKTIDGRATESLVYSDEKVIAFLDIQPVNPGHVLVIPRQHAAGLSDLDEETGAHIFKVAMRITNALKYSGVRCDGVNLLLSDGAAAFQEIFHVHMHVIPRFEGDKFHFSFGHAYGLKPERTELDAVAAKIRGAMN